jgi:hypothetical protein
VILAAFRRGLPRGHRILTVFGLQISVEFDFGVTIVVAIL